MANLSMAARRLLNKDVTTMTLQRRPIFEFLVQAREAAIRGSAPPSLCQTARAVTARLGRNIGQLDHIFGNPVICHKAERRSWSGEIWFAVTEHDRVKVDSILIDEAKFGEALCVGVQGAF